MITTVLQDFIRRLRIIPVSLEDLRASATDFTNLSGRHFFFAVRAAYLYQAIKYGLSHGVGLFYTHIMRPEGNGSGILCYPIDLGDFNSKVIICFDQALRNRRTAAEYMFDR